MYKGIPYAKPPIGKLRSERFLGLEMSLYSQAIGRFTG